MKKTILAVLAATMLLGGCLNIYTRSPLSDERIYKTYQCSTEAFELSVVVAFPQIMSPSGGRAFYWENILTVPCGCLVAVDGCLECVIDTVCWPVDYAMTRKKVNNPYLIK